MTYDSGPVDGKTWKKSPLALIGWTAATLMALQTILRVVLLLKFGGHEAHGTDCFRIFGVGIIVDLFVALLVCLPMIFRFAVVPHKIARSKWHKRLWNGAMVLFWTYALFVSIAEFFFFDEFKSRFNTVAVDYLLYPHEVFLNIWDTYPLVWVIGAAIAFGVAWVIVSHRLVRDAFEFKADFKSRAGILAIAVALVAMLWPMVGNHLTRFSPNRTVNELANNGWYICTGGGHT